MNSALGMDVQERAEINCLFDQLVFGDGLTIHITGHNRSTVTIWGLIYLYQYLFIMLLP